MRAILFLLTFLFANTSLAQVALEKGQPAPEAGVFLTKEQAAKILAEKQFAEQVCKINQEAMISTEKNKCYFDKELLKNELSYEKSKYDEISKLRDVQENRLYDTVSDSGDNLYWFAGGIVAGAATAAAVSISIVLVINQVGQ
jgi:hypothetical protein